MHPDTIYEFDSAVDSPIYRGEYEISHRNCVFIGASERVDLELDLEVLFGNREDSCEWVRFYVGMPLDRSTIDGILGPLFATQNLKKARVWSNGGTVFEVLSYDEALNILKRIRTLPFGDIESYKAAWEIEKMTVLSPSTDDVSGKERLLDFEDELKLFGDAELLSFRRAGKKDLAKKKESPAELSSPWLYPSDARVLSIAIREGYFESPRRTTLDDLAMILGIKRSKLSQDLRSINRKVLERFVREMKEPLPP